MTLHFGDERTSKFFHLLSWRFKQILSPWKSKYDTQNREMRAALISLVLVLHLPGTHAFSHSCDKIMQGNWSRWQSSYVSLPGCRPKFTPLFLLGERTKWWFRLLSRVMASDLRYSATLPRRQAQDDEQETIWSKTQRHIQPDRRRHQKLWQTVTGCAVFFGKRECWAWVRLQLQNSWIWGGADLRVRVPLSMGTALRPIWWNITGRDFDFWEICPGLGFICGWVSTNLVSKWVFIRIPPDASFPSGPFPLPFFFFKKKKKKKKKHVNSFSSNRTSDKESYLLNHKLKMRIRLSNSIYSSTSQASDTCIDPVPNRLQAGQSNMYKHGSIGTTNLGSN